jgi:hypothetical protein
MTVIMGIRRETTAGEICIALVYGENVHSSAQQAVTAVIAKVKAMAA